MAPLTVIVVRADASDASYFKRMPVPIPDQAHEDVDRGDDLAVHERGQRNVVLVFASLDEGGEKPILDIEHAAPKPNGLRNLILGQLSIHGHIAHRISMDLGERT